MDSPVKNHKPVKLADRINPEVIRAAVGVGPLPKTTEERRRLEAA